MNKKSVGSKDAAEKLLVKSASRMIAISARSLRLTAELPSALYATSNSPDSTTLIISDEQQYRRVSSPSITPVRRQHSGCSPGT